MRGRIVKKSLKPFILVTCFAAFAAVGCSGSQQDDENLDSKNDQGNGNNLGQDDAAEGNGQENIVDGDDKKDKGEGADINSATADGATDATLDNAGGAATPPGNATAGATPAATPPPTGATPVAGGRVRYVKQGGVQAVSAPGGQPVMTIEQGEHPVTWEENGYLRIANGLYVPVDALSDKGVARPVTAGGWAH